MIAALHRDGAVIIKNAVSKETCERVITEMTPYVDEYGMTTDGNQAKRPGCVIARSDASWELAAHPLVLDVLEVRKKGTQPAITARTHS